MPQLELATFLPQIFWLTIFFSLLYIIVSKLIAPKAEQLISNRQSVLENDASKATQLSERIEELEEKYKLEIKAIHDEALEIKRQASKKVEDLFARRKEELNKDFINAEQKTLTEIADMRNSAEQQMAESAISFASYLVGKITGQEPSKAALNKYYKKQQ